MVARLVGPPLHVPDHAQTLAGWLARAAEVGTPRDGLRFLDRHEQETWLPWAAVHHRATRAAGALAAAGVGPGDRVAIVLPTAPSFTDAFFGCQVLGAVPVALYPPVRLGRLDEYHSSTAAMLEVAEAAVVISDGRILRALGQTLARYRPPLGVLRDTDLLAGAPHPGHAVASDDLAMVQFSSGTTVHPKAVALSHRAVIAQAWVLGNLILANGPLHTRAGVSWLPLYHDMGLIGCIFPALCAPGPLTLIPPEAFLARPALWLRAISRFGGTVSPAPDFAFALCVERVSDEEMAGCDLSSWTMALDGAEPISPHTVRAFVERFARWGFRPEALTPVYGLSEAALAVTFDDVSTAAKVVSFDRAALARGHAEPASPDRESQEVVSVGRPCPGFQIEVRDERGEPLATGRVGRIFVAGPSLLSRYLGDAEHPVSDGWLETGDLGFAHEGRLYITGRSKDVVILRGRNHAPHDIERATDGVEGVRTGCAVAVGDVDEQGERLVIFVEVRAPRPGLADACRHAVLAATGLDPALVVLLESGTLPRTSSGKLRRAETLRRWKAGTLTPPSKVTPLLLAGALAGSVLGRLGVKTGPT